MIFDIKNLTKSFGAHTALSNLSLEIREPGIYGILGPNGAGKSTFLKLMLKILNPTSGEIYYNGTNIKNIGNSYFNEIGAVLEGNRNLYWFMSARENLLYYGRLMGMADRAIRARTEELLTRNFLNLGIIESRNYIRISYGSFLYAGTNGISPFS